MPLVVYPCVWLCLMLLGLVPAYANTNPAPGQTPGGIIQTNRDFTGGAIRPTQPAKLPDVQGKEAQTIQKIQVEQPDIYDPLKRKIPISHITVEGNTVVSNRKLAPLLATFEGQSWTLAELQDLLADGIGKLYEKEGYVTAVAVIPPQSIKNGELLIKVTEGVLESVTFEPKRYFKQQAVLPRVSTNVGDPLNINDLLRTLRRINESPDIEIGATLKPGQAPGTTALVLTTLEETRPYHLSGFNDNLGRANIGFQRAGLTASHNNLFGIGDTAYVSTGWSRNGFTQLAGYEAPIGSHGTKLGVNQVYTNFDFETAAGKVDGHATILQSYVKQELFRNETLTLESELGLAIKQSAVNFISQRAGQDRLTVFTPALSLQHSDRFGRTLVRSEVGLGVDMLGSMTNRENGLSRPGAGSQFARWTLTGIRSLVLPPQLGYMVFKSFNQIAFNPLNPLEQLQLGGNATVRGYSEGRFIGDSGFILGAESRTPVRVFPQTAMLPKTQLPWNEVFEFVNFVEGGALFNRGNTASVNPFQQIPLTNHAQALSVGTGTRIRLSKYLNARFDVGFPLIHQKGGNASARLHMGLEGNFF
ncbi:MAG: ShlB/FhaC/HecB family hemolysin secretion/activation protein [Vampirovibrionales bacterium]